jgi:tetratricopeptide (TPR) repeat protein
VRTGDLAGADASLAALAEIAEDPEMAATRIWETNTMAQLLVIARDVLAGEIALARGDTEGSVKRLRAAVAAEDRLIYEEPSGWYVPARHNLGAALLQAGRAADAELVYRRDLEIYPDNGWSLRGLARSLEAQDRIKEAKPVRDRFAQVWSGADLEIKSSRL